MRVQIFERGGSRMARQISRRGDSHYAEFMEKTHGNHIFLDAFANPDAGINRPPTISLWVSSTFTSSFIPKLNRNCGNSGPTTTTAATRGMLKRSVR